MNVGTCPCRLNASDGVFWCERQRFHKGACWRFVGGTWRVWGLTPWLRRAA